MVRGRGRGLVGVGHLKQRAQEVVWRNNPALGYLLPSRSWSCYSTVVERANTERGSQEVHVNCRSNGHIKLNIHAPLIAGQSSPVILYLPTGPVGTASASIDDDQVIAALSAASNATIVRINYRLGKGLRYPTPIHDVLAGFDWVKENLSTAKPSATHRGRSIRSMSRYGVCGQLVGGSLATMLALTESRLGESRIAAAAVSNPIVDWVFPENTEETETTSMDDSFERSYNSMKAMATRSKKAKKLSSSWETYKDEQSLSSESLLSARRQFFRKPASYFDSFASPILFFRSPGADVPRDENVFHEDEGDDNDVSSTTARRKAYKAFPPTASSLILPEMRISIGEETPLYDQGEELVKLLRRSIIRIREGRAGNQAMLDRFEEEELDETRKKGRALEEAEQRIEFHMPGRISIWGSPSEPQWRNDVMEVGAWFRRVLG
ncbi:hypothetical protein Vi05172_g4081 [Venturia inaequalis]|nr:hypothetical protein Vi05172_g4081 [Venturia inaequalis]